jgi:hypothetical protein
MRFRQLVIPAAVIIQLMAALILVVNTSRAPAVTIDDAKLAEARAAHQRREAARQRPAPPPRLAGQPAPRTSAATSAHRDPPPQPEPPRRERTEIERPRPALAERETRSSGEVDIDDVREPFDRGQFLEALELAEAYLAREPDQAYIRRIAVTSACAVGNLDAAQKYYDQMDDRDKRTSEQRCARWGVEF